MSLYHQTHCNDYYLTGRETINVCSSCIKNGFISQPPFGAQEISYMQNNRNELNLMETYILVLGSQQQERKIYEICYAQFVLRRPVEILHLYKNALLIKSSM